MQDIYILAGARTPVGVLQGSLSDIGVILAFIYIRVSSDQQEDNASLETQLQGCIAYCLQKGYRVEQRFIYQDVHTATEFWEREGLTQLRDDVKCYSEREQIVTVVYSYDRLSRVQIHQGLIFAEFQRYGVDIESATEQYGKDATGTFLRSASAFASELELERFKDRVRRGRTNKYKRGELLGAGRATLGYNWDEGRSHYVINEYEAAIVREIFDLYVNRGMSINQIMMYLRETYSTKTGKGEWSSSTVQRTLKNTYYIGYGLANKWKYERKSGKSSLKARSAEDNYAVRTPVIVDEVIFWKAQERLQANKERSLQATQHEGKTLLSTGYAICGVCEQPLRVEYKTWKATHTPTYAYNCHDEDSTTRCNSVSIRTHILDAEIWKFVQGVLAQCSLLEERLQAIEATLLKGAIDTDLIEQELARIQQEQRDCALGIVKAKGDDYLIGLLSEESGKLSIQRKQLEDLLEEALGRFAFAELVQEKIARFRQRWMQKTPSLQGEPTFQDKREACQILGVYVYVWRTGQEPRFKIKMLPSEISFLERMP